MDWVIIIGLVVSLVTLTVAAIGTVLAYLNHRVGNRMNFQRFGCTKLEASITSVWRLTIIALGGK